MLQFDKNTPLRVFESFAGYGSQSFALERLHKDFPDFHYKVVGISEIDRYAIQAYYACHDKDIPNFGDISKIDWENVPDFDLFTYSSPCQDFSNAGLQKGAEENSGTRSSLLWECRKAIIAKKPKYLLFENVKAVVGKKFIKLFRKWQNELVSYGYTNFAQVLNSKDYGVPQNRERIFMVSILDCDQHFEFPQPFPLEKRLKDVLETNVPEKYYLSDKTVKMFMERNRINEERGNGFKFEPIDPNSGGGIAKSVTTRNGSRDCDNYIISQDTGIFEKS